MRRMAIHSTHPKTAPTTADVDNESFCSLSELSNTQEVQDIGTNNPSGNLLLLQPPPLSAARKPSQKLPAGSKSRDRSGRTQRGRVRAPNASSKKHGIISVDGFYYEPESFLKLKKHGPVQQEWDWDTPCEYCGKIYLKSTDKESKHMCCMNGEALHENYPKLRELPEVLVSKLISHTEHYSTHSAYYNNIFSIASTTIDNGRTTKYEKILGNSAVKLNGRTVHYIRSVNANHHGGLRYFTFDDTKQMKSHAEFLNGTKREPVYNIDHLEELFQAQKLHNKYVHDLQHVTQRVGEFTELLTSNTVYDDDTGEPFDAKTLVAKTNTLMSDLNISGFSADNVTGNLEFKFQLRNSKTGKLMSTTLRSNDSRVEPLCCPMFHWYGEEGWVWRQTTPVSCKPLEFMTYLCSRLLMPEQDARFWLPNQNGRMIQVNRFQIMSRLMQYYVVENVSRAIDFRLNFEKGRQPTIFGDAQTQLNNEEPINPAEQMAAAEEAALMSNNGTDPKTNGGVYSTKSSKSFLSGGFTGGARHLKELARNALTIVSELKAPTVFITLTFNPHWPEIKDMLLEGQTIFDRPDIADQVFNQRLKQFMHNLKHGKYFGRSNTVYDMRVIEYQHRSLPHAHIVARLKNHPDNDTEIDDKINFIDKYISAQYPSDETEENAEYCKLIKKHMIHGCSTAVNGCKKDNNCLCKRGYESTVIRNTTSFDERGYPIYKRPKQKDLRVVPHNRDILLDWQGHSNVEFCGKSYAVVYLYNYLFKGNQKVSFKLNNTDDLVDGDEINMYLRGRMLNAMDATWRIFGYHTYPATKPHISLVKVYLETMLVDMAKNNKTCMLSVYFNRPLYSCFDDMLYTQFTKYWMYSYSLPVRYKNYNPHVRYTESQAANSGVFHIDTVTTRRIYIFKRTNPDDNIVRLGMLWISAGEIWYLRLLIMHYAARWYDGLKSVNGILYPTFQAAAIARELVEHNDEAVICFTEAAQYSTSKQLRNVFYQLTKEGWTTIPIFYTEELFMRLIDMDILPECNGNVPLATNKLLTELQRRFVADDKSLEMYGLPMPDNMESMLQREKLRYDRNQQLSQYHQSIVARPMNERQQEAFDAVKEAYDDCKGSGIFLIQGKAGTGKSTFAKAVVQYCRGHGGLVQGCASTALAASVYENMGFDTAHGLFSIPVVEDAEELEQEGDLKCKFIPGKPRQE